MGSLTKEQRSLVIGSLLGDGAMRCKRNALLEINHCLAQHEYVDWKYRLLADLVGTPPKVRCGNGTRVAYRFTTLSRPELTPIYKAFYEGRRKVVPPLELTPLTLAVWFMDDGSKSHRSIYLNTQQFDRDSQDRLVRALREQCGIEATLNRDKTYYRLRIAVGSVPKFRCLVERHVLETFRYKLPS